MRGGWWRRECQDGVFHAAGVAGRVRGSEGGVAVAVGETEAIESHSVNARGLTRCPAPVGGGQVEVDVAAHQQPGLATRAPVCVCVRARACVRV